MLNLRKFYLKNIEDSSPYIKYYEEIESSSDNLYFDAYPNNLDVIIYDDVNVAIQEFKELIQPENENHYKGLNSLKFILVCFYLNYHAYYIVQFPDFLAYSTNLSDFAYKKIRNLLITNDRSDNGTVRWAERRKFIEELRFERKEEINTNFHEAIEERFQKISTRGAAFDNMSNHEKLKEIANYLENVLKVNGKYISVNKEEMINLISDDFIKKYKKTLQCYRHSSESSLVERKKLKDKEDFLIHLGISIIHGLPEN